MATWRESALRLADVMRGLTAPGVWDYRTVKAQIIRRVWVGGEAGADGGFVDTVLSDFPQAYRVANLSASMIASSGGRFEAGAVKVGPITPVYSNVGGASGGFTPTQLDPAPGTAVTGTEIVYRLTGAETGDYRLAQVDTDSPVSYYIVLNRTRITP